MSKTEQNGFVPSPMPFIFLISTERSGSNLISKMIDGHPEFCSPSPSHMIRTFSLNRLRYGDLRIPDNWHTLSNDVADFLNHQLGKWHMSWSASKIQEGVETRSLPALIRHVYQTEARAHGKTRVFVKENYTYRFAAFLLIAFPDAKFVYLVRDPRDVALSWKLSPNHPGGVHRGAQVWQNDQSKSLELFGFLQDTDRIVLLRYEDLVSRAEDELRRVCLFLNVPFTTTMLEFYKNELTIANAKRLNNWRNLQKPVLTKNTQKYRAGLSALEIQYIEALCRREMEALGYPLDFPPTRDLAALENELVAFEEDTSAEQEVLDENEKENREKRLAILHEIINRRLPRLT